MSVGLGFVVGVRGIVGKEVRSRTRGFWRPMLLLSVYLGLLALSIVAVLAVSVASSGTVSPYLGQGLFTALAAGSVLLIAFIGPALTAGTISGERERRTLDLLLVTRASPLGLVAGKLAGALLWVLYLEVASLPALAIVNLFGGAAIVTALATMAVIAATALGYTALGLLMSAIFRRTVLATVLSYAIVLITVIVLPLVNASMSLATGFFAYQGGVVRSPGVVVFAVSSGASQPPPFGLPPAQAWLGFISPVNALFALLGNPLTPSAPVIATIVSPFATYFLRAPGSVTPPESITSFSTWVFYCLLCVAWAVYALLLAAVVLRPVPFWRRRRQARGG